MGKMCLKKKSVTSACFSEKQALLKKDKSKASMNNTHVNNLYPESCLKLRRGLL